MHKQQPVNPQGSFNSVAANRLYFNGRYETAEEYEQRLNNDLAKVQAVFKEHLGHPLKALVWPYGLFSGKSVDIALANGFEATFMLDGGINQQGVAARHYAKRGLVYGNIDAAGLKKLLSVDLENWQNGNLRMAQVDVDRIYNKDRAEMDQNIAALKERLYANQVRVVALQAFADPDGDGNVEGVYFYNEQVPVVADVFNYIANSLLQDGYRTIAWMPSLAMQTFIKPDDSNLVAANPAKNLGWYRRITPFDRQAQEQLKKLYSDLGNYTMIDGVLFQDDLYLNDFEDNSLYGQKAYAERMQRPLAKLDRSDSQAMDAWTALKTERINELVRELAAAFKENRPNGVVMRNIYTEPVLNPNSEEWFAQNFTQYLQDYDYTIVMAYPYMDKAADPKAYLQKIGAAVKSHPGAVNRVFFKLQSYDWAREKWVTEADLNKQVGILENLGAVNIGYYPDTSMVLKPKCQTKQQVK